MDLQDIHIARKDPQYMEQIRDAGDLHNDWVSARHEYKESERQCRLDKSILPKAMRKTFKIKTDQ